MRKILTVIILLLFVNVAKAQTFGAKGGINFSTHTGEASEFFETRTSYVVGVFFRFPLLNEFILQPELLFSSQGAKIAELELTDELGNPIGGYGAVLKLNYLNVPLLAKYYFTESLSIHAGPQIGYLLAAKSEIKSQDMDDGETDIKDAYKNIDVAVVFGIGYELKTGIGFDVRYNVGLNNVRDVEDGFEGNNGVLQITANYAF
jgi:hypothetical protein